MTGAPDTSDEFDVAIVGYGPTGATLANLLALCGIRTVVLEREAEIYQLPRAVHFDDETMRVFQTIGIADELTDRVRLNPGMRFVDAGGDLLMDWPRPPEISAQGWHPSYRFHQPDLEELLRRKLETYDSAEVKSRADVINLNERADRVDVTYRDRDTDRETTIAARYVVGCDGARSFVGDRIGGGAEDLGFRERWLVVDFLLNREMPELGDHTIQYCVPDRPMTYCRSPANRRRWEIKVLDDETDAEISAPDRIWDLLSQWISRADAELERNAVYTFHSSIAETWRAGRLMIAGDAAHLTPPFMGQGMCAGIRDAANLAWKLALCVRNAASPDLLDSYQAERIPHVRMFISTAVRLGGLINSLDRDSALAMAKAQTGGKAILESLLPQLGENTPLFDTPESPHAGRLFGQPTLADGRRLDDVSGYAPVLLHRGEMPLPVGTRDGRDMALLSADGNPALVAALDELEASAVLIRPDRYIAASVRTAAEIASLAAVGFPSPLPVSGGARHTADPSNGS